MASSSKHSTNFVNPEKTKTKTIKESTNKIKKGHKKVRKFFLWFFVIIIVVIFTIGIFGYTKYPHAMAAYEKALQGKNNFLEAQELVKQENFREATVQLEEAHTNFQSAYDDFQELDFFENIPLVSTQIKAVDKILIAGIQTSSAIGKITAFGDEIITELKPEGAFDFHSISSEEKREVLKKIFESPPDLQGVQAEIDLAMYALDEIPEFGVLSQIKSASAPLKDGLPQINDIVDQAIPALEALPQIVGYPEQKNYLFLLQNNTELRPTGGFIGTYGVLKVKDGEIAEFHTDNIYNIDEPAKYTLDTTPPWQIEKYLKVDTWFMRDANWSPDFPTSAEKALELYELEGGTEQFDGVIAVTPTLIESLLELTGEITVWGITFNSDNVVDVLEYQVEQGYYRQGISDADRKEVIGALADELMDRILSLPKERWVELWNVFEKDVSEKHILIYLENNDLQQLVLDQGWAGEIRDANGDYFMFIDANLASLKTDPGIKRTIKYHLDQDTAKVDINYHNEGVFNWKSTRYRTYARLCVPLGAELTEYSGAMENDKLHGGQPGEVETIQEKGKTCFGAFISIEPQERGTLSFTYKLPQNITNQINNGQYQLLVQKQAGTIAHDLEIELNFPKNIKYYQPLDKTGSVDNNTIIFKDDLRQDREYTITF